MNRPNGRVLVLNNSFEPFSTMSVPQAMRKLSKTDSVLYVVEWSDRTLGTSRGEYPVPSVVRLNYFLDIRKKREKSGTKRFSIYRRDKFHCQYCQIRITDVTKLTLDHILPRSRGGRNAPDNLVTSCIPCNHRKGNRTPDEARMTLLTPQSLLRVRLDTVQFSSDVEYNPIWKKYLFLEGSGETNLMATGTDDDL